MEKTLTLHLTDDQAELLQLIIDQTPDISTSSKMLIHCMELYLVDRIYFKDVEGRIKSLQEKNLLLTTIIQDARIAAINFDDDVDEEEFYGPMN